jgi:predicted DCC family thiol-disulfide oxidoreductase YuxK
MFLAQVGIYHLMGVLFLQFMFVYLFWVPWDRIGQVIERAVKRVRGNGTYVMLFDGGCGICRSVASVVTRLDLLHRIEPVDVLNEWPLVSERFPALTQERCLTDMHVVRPDGKVVTRFEAYRSLAWTIPALWLVLPILYVPGVPLIGDRIYGYVAASRGSSCVVGAGSH